MYLELLHICILMYHHFFVAFILSFILGGNVGSWLQFLQPLGYLRMWLLRNVSLGKSSCTNSQYQNVKNYQDTMTMVVDHVVDLKFVILCLQIPYWIREIFFCNLQWCRARDLLSTANTSDHRSTWSVT